MIVKTEEEQPFLLKRMEQGNQEARLDKAIPIDKSLLIATMSQTAMSFQVMSKREARRKRKTRC